MEQASGENSIGDIGLSLRTRNVLKRANLEDRDRLYQEYAAGQLLSVRGLGSKGFLEVVEALSRLQSSSITPAVSERLLNEPIDQFTGLGLSGRTGRALIRANITSPKDLLLAYQSGIISRVPQVGEKGIQQIQTVLISHERELPTTTPEDVEAFRVKYSQTLIPQSKSRYLIPQPINR